MIEGNEKFSTRFDINFEKKILKIMVVEPNFLAKASKFIRKEYFSTEILQWLYEHVVAYYNAYQKTITKDALFCLVRELKDKPLLEYAKLIAEVYDMEVQEQEFIIQKVTEWLQRNVYTRGFTKSGVLFNNGKVEESYAELMNTLETIRKINFNPPERTFFFNEVENRMLRRNFSLLDGNDDKYSTGVMELDAYTNGGLGRGELGVVVGGPKTGKSIFLVNCGGHNIGLGRKVLHIQLEGTAKQAEDRYEAKLLNWEYRKVVRNDFPENFRKRYARFDNSLVIRFCVDHWEYTVADIEEEVKELKTYGFSPDMIIVDYGDLLSPRTRELKDSTYLAQQEVFRDLKTLAMKYNIAVWTASQVTRAPKDKKPREDSSFVWTRNELADSFAKVRVCDLLVTLNMTDEEQKQKRMRIYLDAYRDDERGQIIPINTNYQNMQFYVPTQQSWELWNRSYIE